MTNGKAPFRIPVLKGVDGSGEKTLKKREKWWAGALE